MPGMMICHHLDRTLGEGEDTMTTLLSIRVAALHCNLLKHMWLELLFFLFFFFCFLHSHADHIVVGWCSQTLSYIRPWWLAFFMMSFFTDGSPRSTEESSFILSFTIRLFTAQTRNEERNKTQVDFFFFLWGTKVFYSKQGCRTSGLPATLLLTRQSDPACKEIHKYKKNRTSLSCAVERDELWGQML